MVAREELFVKSDHSTVLVPLHEQWPCTGTHSFDMDSPGAGDKHDTPPPDSKPLAIIKILDVQEIAFIPQAHGVNRLPSDHHRSAGDRLYLNSFCGDRIAVLVEI